MGGVIERELERIYGGGDFAGPVGVLHVAAVCRDSDGGLAVLRTEAASAPRSGDDRLMLGLARARADVIVTTAANLRAEPRLSHRLHGDEAICRALAEWQRRDARRVLVLTASGDLPLDHQVFSETPPPIIVTGDAGAERLRRSGFEPAHIALREQPSLRDTIAWARACYEAETVLIEAGPSTTRELYADPVLVDELMLSVCNDRVDSNAIGPQLFDRATTSRILARSVPSTAGWSFHRLFPNQADGFA